MSIREHGKNQYGVEMSEGRIEMSVEFNQSSDSVMSK